MKDAPQGFRVLSEGAANSLTITYKSHGMGCLLSFTLVIPLILGGTFLTFAIVSPLQFHEFIFSTWWTPICALCGLIAIVYFLHFSLFHLFGLIKIVATDQDLTVCRTLWFLTGKSRIERTKIGEFVQFKDGGGDEDSFPSWGLKVVGAKTVNLISRQPIEKSDWLGVLLARHFEVDYIPADLRD